MDLTFITLLYKDEVNNLSGYLIVMQIKSTFSGQDFPEAGL